MHDFQMKQRTRRSFLQRSLGATAAASMLGRASRGAVVQASTPVNIVYMHSHDSGRYLRPYGHDVPTPNLLRLAKQGVLFRQMHAAAPTCSPSRAAMLTGQTPHEAGMLGLAHLGWSLNDYHQHIVHTLSAHGYRSALAGVQHVAADPAVIGYDEILEHQTTSAKDVAPAAIKFLRSRPKEPFFLDVGFFETHRKFPKPVDNADYILPPAPLPDVPETRLDMAGFHASARVLDAGVGAVLDALEEYGFAQNTLVISTTDHGIAFPDMKCSLKDAGTGVSMIVRGPGVFGKGQVCDALLSQIDLFPTLCDFLKIEKPSWLRGKSFLPILEGAQKEIHEAIFAEVTFHAAYEPKRSVRTARWKYIRHFDQRERVVLPNCDDGLSKSFWMDKGWKTLPAVRHEELYDLVFDPNEKNNLLAESGVQTELKKLREKMDVWMRETNDPLLRGQVPLISGGHIVDQDAESPESLGRYVSPKLR